MAACSSLQSAALASITHAFRGDALVDRHPLDPRYSYLRVTSNGKAGLLVLGNVDQDATGQPVQVWYSAGSEVLRLRAGRLAGLEGTPVEWRTVRWPEAPPPWEDVGQHSQVAYTRDRDEMPGYRLGLKDALSLKQIPPPSSSEWRGPVPPGLQWYEEVPANGTAFTARYAVQRLGDAALPLYGEQCLARDFCLTWQVWPSPVSTPPQAVSPLK